MNKPYMKFDSEHVLAPYKNKKRWLEINVIALVTGSLCGLAAVLFRKLVIISNYFFIQILLPLLNIKVGSYNTGFIILGALGGLIVGIITNKFSEDAKGTGIPEIIESATLKRGKIKPEVGFVKIITSPISIATGSAGREGPIAQIGAWLGSLIGNKLQLHPYEIRLIIASGVASGVAGTFNAPLGGAIFSLEILFNGFGIFSAIPVFLSSVIGAEISQKFFGSEAAFNYAYVQSAIEPQEFALIVLFGIIIGLLGFFWVKFFCIIRKTLLKICISSYLRPILGGICAGAIIAIFPEQGLNGTGYSGINLALNHSILPITMLILAFLKMCSTSFTLGSDNTGGVFGPSLYIGCMFGGVFGWIFQQIFQEFVSDYSIYMILGMAAMFAAAAQSPINMSILIAEKTKDFWLIPLVMLACGCSFIVSSLIFKHSSIYTVKLEMRGINLKVGSLFVLKNIRVEEILEQSKKECFINSENENEKKSLPFIDHFATLQDTLDKMEEYGTDSISVIKNHDHTNIIGIVSKKDILNAIY